MGRPTKLTDDRSRRIVASIRAGAYQDVAARAAGVAPATFYRWLERGKTEQEQVDAIDAAVKQLDEQLRQHPPARARRGRTRARRGAAAARRRLLAERRALIRERNLLEHDDAYREFREAVTRASDEAEVAAIAQVRAGAQGEHADWRAAAWFLERRFPGRWRRRETHELTGSETEPVRSIVAVDATSDLADAAHAFLAHLEPARTEPAPPEPG